MKVFNLETQEPSIKIPEKILFSKHSTLNTDIFTIIKNLRSSGQFEFSHHSLKTDFHCDLDFMECSSTQDTSIMEAIDGKTCKF